MTDAWVLRGYRQLVRLYPRRFREDYGPDLVLLLATQLRDEPTWRVLSRSAVDLALTVPARHLEAHMDRSSTNLVPALFGAVALAAVIVAVVVGHPILLVACIAVGATAACAGLLAAHRARPLSDPRPSSAQWWKLTAAGAGLLAALIGVTTATGELPEGAWLLAMITGLAALLLLGSGVVLGIARLASWPSRRTTAP